MCHGCRWACLHIFTHICFRAFFKFRVLCLIWSGTTEVYDNCWVEMDDCHLLSRVCSYGPFASMRTSLCRHFDVASLFAASSHSLCRDLQVQMGRVRTRERRTGIRRDGPAGRANEERAHDLARAAEDIAAVQQRERARDRQRECRRRRRHAASVGSDVVGDDGSLSENEVASEDGVNRRLVRRDVAGILACVQRTLGRHMRPRAHKKAVIRTVWDSPCIRELLPRDAQKVSSEVHAREGIVSSLLQSLSEVKTSKTRAQLVTKHAILTAAITNGTRASARQTARLLGVHHRNVTMAANRRATMLSSVHIQWTLSVRKTRSDATSPFVKDIVGEWWSTQTRPSPNRKEVVRKWVAPKTYVQHHAQYLLESLVSCPIPLI